MKKFLSILLVCMLVFALGACNNNGDTDTTQEPTGEPTYEINWSTLPDSDIVGAYAPADSDSGEYVLFTDDGKLRVVYGTAVFDADIQYGEDGYGNKSAYTEGNYLYGQWTYTIEDNTLTVYYSDEQTNVFNRINYTPITLEAKEDFVKDDRLVGKWLNYQYGDSYEFTEDGYAIFHQDVDDGIYVYETEIKHTYTVNGDEVTFYFYQSNDGEEVEDSATVTIDGTKLLIGESDYYLNGEGSPTATEASVIE